MGWGGVVQSGFIVKPNLVLRLGWGFDNFIKIGSVTAKILLTLSLCGGWWWGLQSHFLVKPNLVLRLGWGFDNTVKTNVIL